jgi:serine/threonine-protein kinase
MRFGGSVLRPDELEAGVRVAGGAYEIIGVLGRGGMATVYSARRQADGREVALKVLNAKSAARADVEHRLQNERMLAAEVGGHPSIVAAIDGGRLDEQGGAPFLVTERVHGPELSYVLATERRLEPLRACRLALDIADALAALHARGIVHRDVKPDNILVVTGWERATSTGDGIVRPLVSADDLAQMSERAKLIDFGLATRIAAPNDASDRVTLANERPGTPMYMSPEQSVGAPATAAFDVYGLGVTLYEMLAGVTPFAGVPEFELLEYKVHRHAAMDLLSARADLPVALAPLVMGCLAPMASDRLRMSALEAGLRAVLGLRRADPERRVDVTELSPRAGAIEVRAAAEAEAAAEVGSAVGSNVGYQHDEATAAAIAFADAMPKREFEARRVWDRETVEKLRLATAGKKAEAEAKAAAEAAAEADAADVAEAVAAQSTVVELPSAIASSSAPTADEQVAPVAPVGPSRAEMLLRIHAPDPEVPAEARQADRSIEDGPRSGRWIAAGLGVAAIAVFTAWWWLRPDPTRDASQGQSQGHGVGASLVPDAPNTTRSEPTATAPETPPVVQDHPPQVIPPEPPKVEASVPTPTPRKPESTPKGEVRPKPEVTPKPETTPKPTPPEAPNPATTAECAATRRAAADALARDEPGDALASLALQECWSDRLAHRRTLVGALMQAKKYDRCVRVGRGSKDPEIVDLTETCAAMLEEKSP